MSKAAWERLGYAALAVITFMCTLVAIRWTIDFVAWSTMDSGQLQAVGSIAALGVAIFIMSRQNAHSAKLIIETESRQIQRRIDATSFIVERAMNQIANGCEGIERNLGDCEKLKPQLAALLSCAKSTKAALDNIPVHDLSTYALAEAVQEMKDCVANTVEVVTVWHAGAALVGDDEHTRPGLALLLGMAETAFAKFKSEYEKTRRIS